MAIDKTVRIFDEFYNLDLVVDADQYEIVLSFFKQYSKEVTARAFAQTLFRIANDLQESVMNLLATFEGADALQVNLTMAYYLNSSSSNRVVMFGVNNVLTPVNSIQRNIVQ